MCSGDLPPKHPESAQGLLVPREPNTPELRTIAEIILGTLGTIWVAFFWWSNLVRLYSL